MIVFFCVSDEHKEGIQNDTYIFREGDFSTGGESSGQPRASPSIYAGESMG